MQETLIFVHFDWFSVVFVASALGLLSLVGPWPWPPLAAGKNNENNENTIKMNKKSTSLHFDCFSLFSLFVLFRPWVD